MSLRRFFLSVLAVSLFVPAPKPVWAADDPAQTKPRSPFEKESMKKSPSFQQKKWTGTQASMESNVQYDYIGGADQNLGNGRNEDITEDYFDLRHQFIRHTLLAFLVYGGLEYQHMGFGVPNDALIPDRMDMAYADVVLETRWSEKDLLHIEVRPGLYTDFRGGGWGAFNTPVDIGYTRVTSPYFQWVVGFSYNSWRSNPFLGAAGFRWQWHERWKLKFYMPTPAIEYRVRPDLTALIIAADFRGETYRVGPHFGESKGRPELNGALLDYQESRVGTGFSWNIKPLIELNFMTGYLLGRQYDFHNNELKLRGSGSPFVSLALHVLMKMPGEPLRIPQRNRISVRDLFKFW